MRRHRNVKIVATLGPSSSDLDTIRALFQAGADVFRGGTGINKVTDLKTTEGDSATEITP